MWLKLGALLAWEAVKSLLFAMLPKKQTDADKAIKDYKNEQDIKNHPALPDNAAIDRLPE